jgi:hypothetical protein
MLDYFTILSIGKYFIKLCHEEVIKEYADKNMKIF